MAKQKLHLAPRTDLGNAEFFASLNRDRFCFDYCRKKWVCYQKHWWEADSDGELIRAAKHTIRYRLRRCDEISDEESRNKEQSWCRSSESRARLEAMVKLAQAEKPLADRGENWNCGPWLFGVANGVVDLKTGKLRAGRPEDRISLHTQVAFDPHAQAPRWERFLSEVFNSNGELILYIQRAIGYSLTGDTSEQCFFCCYGTGANGKGRFLHALMQVFGGYGLNLPFSAFELAARTAISNDVATLPGRRFVTAIETDESVRLNEARIKSLTGGDHVTARLLYGEFFTFIPVCKIWLAFNHTPVVADDSHGFWRRIHLIPFTRQFDTQAEPNLDETLSGEAPGILAWAVRGCLAWKSEGLRPPQVVLAATQTYREDSDPVIEFLDDRFIRGTDLQINVSRVWQEYSDWRMENSIEEVLSRAQFNRRLESFGLHQVRVGHDRDRVWQGMGLKGSSDARGLLGNADKRTTADTNLR